MTKRSFHTCDALDRTQHRLTSQRRQHLGSSRRQRATQRQNDSALASTEVNAKQPSTSEGNNHRVDLIVIRSKALFYAVTNMALVVNHVSFATLLYLR